MKPNDLRLESEKPGSGHGHQKPEPAIGPHPGPGGPRPDPVDLLSGLERILKPVLEAMARAETHKAILDRLEDIKETEDEILQAIRGLGAAREAEIVALLDTTFTPIIDGLKEIQ